ncbi:MAG: hypothetical protein JNK90_27345 [Planctomycetaceae bacterium]|nr:hypothetical protein [Planctomycetaceae bacterium]
MGIQYNPSKLHWNYFLAIERDFETVARYIEPCDANNNTFSLELARIIMAATQEVDVVMKLLCELICPGCKKDKINDYFPIIRDNLKDFKKEIVELPRFGMASSPWIDWTAAKSPLWWQANNKIKHERSKEFHQATFKHAFNAMGGLLLTVAYYYNRTLAGGNAERYWPDVTDTLTPTSTLFRLRQSYYRI